MKRILLLSLISISLLTACKTNQEKAEYIADEVCQALSNYREEDSKSFLEAATNLEQVNLKYENSSPLHSDQFISIMEKKCPDGYRKYVRMVEK